MIKVKICGLTNLNDARCAVAAGADFLGFVFVKKSPRYIAPEKARCIIRGLPAKVFKVGVFVDEDSQKVKEIAARCGLDYIQFHGQESVAYLKKFPVAKIIRAIRVKGRRSLAHLTDGTARYFLLDTYRKGIAGGTGETFSWELLSGLKGSKTPFFISGGLTPDNVSVLLARIRPYGVDVSSGVEKAPGLKDRARVKEFIKKVKG